MNRYVRAFACALLLTGATGPAFSASQSITTTIAKVYPLGSGNLILILASDHASCTSPNTPDYYKALVNQNGVTEEGLVSIHATAMTAFALGRTVSIYFDDATPDCLIKQILLRQ
jgi:hypothetical protein